MSDQQMPARTQGTEEAISPFDELVGGAGGGAASGAAAATAAGGSAPFTTAFRGYDRDEVDAAIARLTARLRADGNKIEFLEKRYRRVSEAANSHSRETVDQLEAEYDAKLQAAGAQAREAADRMKSELAAANARAAKAEQRIQAEVEAAGADSRENVERLEAELATATARAATAEQRVQTLSEELVDGGAFPVARGVGVSQAEEALGREHAVESIVDDLHVPRPGTADLDAGLLKPSADKPFREVG